MSRVDTPAAVPGTALTLEAVYEAHAAKVAGWAMRLSGGALDSEDLVHEIFLTVHEQLPRFRGEAKLTTWLYRITENVVRDRRRKERRRWWHTQRSAEQPRVNVPTPIEELERRQATRQVYEVLEKLKDKQRTVLILFELEGLSGEEIAELTDMRIETVWVTLHRAREAFRARLHKQRLAAQRSEHER